MKLGIIGCGKMGRALLGGILDAGLVAAPDVTVHDAYAPAAQSAVDELGVCAADNNADVVAAADTILLCVKPQTFPEMLNQVDNSGTEGKLLISIAAGVRIRSIEKGSGHRHRVIRVMPNTPALVGKGASAFAVGSSATLADAETARSLLAAVGYVTQVEEEQIDAVTALSGSGPAYIFCHDRSADCGGNRTGTVSRSRPRSCCPYGGRSGSDGG